MHPGGTGPVALIDFQCEDCLSFRLACRADDLPKGVSQHQAATLITEHVRNLRGYSLSVGGYHTTISGWLSCAYWAAAGIFVLHTDRGSSAGLPALDVLIQALSRGLVQPSHPAMLDPQQYQTQEVYLSVVPPPTVTTMASLLASPHVRATWARDYCKVTLAEFLPVSRAGAVPIAPTPPAAAPPAPVAPPPAAAVSLGGTGKLGDRCPVCGEIVKERWLLTSTFVGCRCG